MSKNITKEVLMLFLKGLGERSRGPGKCYLTGGTSAVLVGWRESTIDIDLKFDPEPKDVFDALQELKRDLSVHVELASPDDFIPAIQNWKETSQFIGRFGSVDFYHYNFIAQALAKISRGHDRDLTDVRALLRLGLVKREDLLPAFHEISPALKRYPSLNAKKFEEKIIKFLSEGEA